MQLRDELPKQAADLQRDDARLPGGALADELPQAGEPMPDDDPGRNDEELPDGELAEQLPQAAEQEPGGGDDGGDHAEDAPRGNARQDNTADRLPCEYGEGNASDRSTRKQVPRKAPDTPQSTQ